MKQMVRAYVELPRGNADEAIENWLSSHPRWPDDPSRYVFDTAEFPDKSGYVFVDARFLEEQLPSTVIDDLVDRLEGLQGGLWYRVGYHECDHDEEKRDGCSWLADAVRESGDIPGHVPEVAP